MEHCKQARRHKGIYRILRTSVTIYPFPPSSQHSRFTSRLVHARGNAILPNQGLGRPQTQNETESAKTWRHRRLEKVSALRQLNAQRCHVRFTILAIITTQIDHLRYTSNRNMSGRISSLFRLPRGRTLVRPAARHLHEVVHRVVAPRELGQHRQSTFRHVTGSNTLTH